TGSELAKEPAVLELVVEHNRVARQIGAVGYRKAVPQVPEQGRTEQPGAGLGVHSEHHVHHLHVEVRAHFAVWVGWREQEGIVTIGQTFKSKRRGRDERRSLWPICCLKRSVAGEPAVGREWSALRRQVAWRRMGRHRNLPPERGP